MLLQFKVGGLGNVLDDNPNVVQAGKHAFSAPILIPTRVQQAAHLQAKFVLPASRTLAIAPGLEISYRLRSRRALHRHFTSGESHSPVREPLAPKPRCGGLHAPN